MKKSTVIRHAHGIRPLAALLDITTQAIYKWPADVPPDRVKQLKELRPKWFEKKGKS